MGPSAYHAELAKDQVIEDRDQVRVVFKGGNVFHLFDGEAETPQVVRGVNKAWERAEAIRKELNPDYSPPAVPEGEETGENGGDNAAATSPANPPPPAGETTASGEGPNIPGGSEVVTYGDVEGVQTLLLVADVEVLLADWQGRIASLRGSDEVRQLQARVSATDGRCAPIFFTQAPGEDVVHLFDGLRTFAAALDAGLERIAVVILPADKVGEVQGIIAVIGQAALKRAELESEDDLIYRVHSYD
jgi:hypothetical protein